MLDTILFNLDKKDYNNCLILFFKKNKISLAGDQLPSFGFIVGGD